MLPIILTTLGTLILVLALALVAVALLAVVFAPFDDRDEPLASLRDEEDWH